MKKTVFTFLIMSFALSLSAQTKGKIKTKRPNKILKTKKAEKLPAGTDLDELYLHDLALSKCDRYMRYYKRVLKLVLISNPTVSNPLEITKQINRARVLYVSNTKQLYVLGRLSTELNHRVFE